jgi:hypothetical protein
MTLEDSFLFSLYFVHQRITVAISLASAMVYLITEQMSALAEAKRQCRRCIQIFREEAF